MKSSYAVLPYIECRVWRFVDFNFECTRGAITSTLSTSSCAILYSLYKISTAVFANTGVQVTSEGRPYLGAAIGTDEFVISHVQDKVTNWTKELDNLATIALIQPHTAHAAFTNDLSSKWSYVTCTIHGISTLLQPLETVKITPALTGQPPPNDELRNLLALPARLGGIALVTPPLMQMWNFLLQPRYLILLSSNKIVSTQGMLVMIK